MTRTVLCNCPVKTEIRAVDSQSDLIIFLKYFTTLAKDQTTMTLEVACYLKHVFNALYIGRCQRCLDVVVLCTHAQYSLLDSSGQNLESNGV